MDTVMLNPIVILLGKDIMIKKDDAYPEDIYIKDGVTFDNDHYGFIITHDTADEFSCSYPTQCPIESIRIEDGNLVIYEKHKSISWKINPNDGCIYRKARFLDIADEDTKYLESKGIVGKKEIKKVNSYFR